jgi:hypothetical protein
MTDSAVNLTSPGRGPRALAIAAATAAAQHAGALGVSLMAVVRFAVLGGDDLAIVDDGDRALAQRDGADTPLVAASLSCRGGIDRELDRAARPWRGRPWL